MTDIPNLIVNILVPALSLTIPALITAGLTYILVNSYERKKDKVAIKQQLASVAVDYAGKRMKKLNLQFEVDCNKNVKIQDEIDLLTDEINILSDKLLTLVMIYSKNSNDDKELNQLLQNISNTFNKMARGELTLNTHEIYTNNLDSLSDEIEKIYLLIKNMQIDYKV